MAGNKSSNPFFTEDDEDESWETHNKLQQQINDSEDRQLDSTKRCLQSLYESERMGIATGEELLKQGEQLNNIEKKTTEINQAMVVTQKHLNSIKSVFGGIKNWWNNKKSTPDETKPEERPSRLQETLDRDRNSKPHPAMRLKGQDYGGFYEEDNDLDNAFMAGSKSHDPARQYITPVTRSRKEEEINENLGLMSDGLSNLKNLALGLGDEIGRQNEQIDRIQPNMGKANDLLENQNKQMRKILRK